jgi:hypothetical protein
LEFKVVDKTFGVLVIPLYSLFFYAALTEFVFGPVERAVTESEPSLGDMV